MQEYRVPVGMVEMSFDVFCVPPNVTQEMSMFNHYACLTK